MTHFASKLGSSLDGKTFRLREEIPCRVHGGVIDFG